MVTNVFSNALLFDFFCYSHQNFIHLNHLNQHLPLKQSKCDASEVESFLQLRGCRLGPVLFDMSMCHGGRGGSRGGCQDVPDIG